MGRPPSVMKVKPTYQLCQSERFSALVISRDADAKVVITRIRSVADPVQRHFYRYPSQPIGTNLTCYLRPALVIGLARQKVNGYVYRASVLAPKSSRGTDASGRVEGDSVLVGVSLKGLNRHHRTDLVSVFLGLDLELLTRSPACQVITRHLWH